MHTSENPHIQFNIQKKNNNNTAVSSSAGLVLLTNIQTLLNLFEAKQPTDEEAKIRQTHPLFPSQILILLPPLVFDNQQLLHAQLHIHTASHFFTKPAPSSSHPLNGVLCCVPLRTRAAAWASPAHYSQAALRNNKTRTSRETS